MARILYGATVATAFLLSAVASAQSQHIELDVAAAEVRRSVQGYPAVEVTFSPESRQAFATLTTTSVGRMLEYRLAGEVVHTARLQTPITGGRVQMIVAADRAAELARELSVAGTKLEVSVIDEKR